MLPAPATQYCPSTRVAGEEVCTSAVAGKAIDCRAAFTVVAPVPPLATGRVPVICEVRSTPDKVPPKVRVPVVVIVPPVRVIPLTVPVVAIEVTVPLSESAAEVQAPAPSLFNTFPEAPGEVSPVPPLAAANVPAVVIVPAPVIGPPE